MVSSFELGQVTQPLEQGKYMTPGAMEQEGETNLKAPWASTVLPAIWDNVETSGDILKGGDNISALNAKARENKESRLSVDALKAKYPNVNFQTPMFASTAEYIAQRQTRIQNLEWLKEHSTVKAPGAMFIPEVVSYIGKSFTDPVELGIMGATALLTAGAGIVAPQLTKFTGAGIAHKIAGMAIPENYIMAEMAAASLPLSARMGGRFTAGFVENALGNLAVEPWIASASRKLGDDYTGLNSAMNVFVGGLMGGTFHVGGGLVADPFTRMHAQAKLKAAAEYIAIREAGGDGVTAAAQNVLPQTTLAARDVINNKGIKVRQTEEGHWRAYFNTEEGTLQNYDGILGRTPADAIRNLQYTYATVMRDPVLFGQLNALYGNKTSAKVGLKESNPFAGANKVSQIKNANTVTKGGKKFKLNFDSPVDKMFYNIQTIMNNPKNKGKAFNDLTVHKDTLMSYVDWITNNIGDTTEADIKKQARGIYNAVHNQIKENLNAKSEATDIKIGAFIKQTDLDVQPEFLSQEAWAERLQKQKEILLGNDKIAAVNLLEELYKVDKEVQAARLERLKAARGDIQKLINTTDEQLHKFTKRELARKNVVDSILATGTKVSSEQLSAYLYMLDIVTGDFAKWVEDNGIEFVSAKDFQAKTEKRLNQEVKVPISKTRRAVTNYAMEPLNFYTMSVKELANESYTATNLVLSPEATELLIEIKSAKYSIQDDLQNMARNFDVEIDSETPGKVNILDALVAESFVKEDMILYRAVPREGAMYLRLADVKPGQIIQSPGYLSGTANRMITERFYDYEEPIELQIKLGKGMKALDVEATIAENLKFTRYGEAMKGKTSFDDFDFSTIDAVNFDPTEDNVFNDRLEFLLLAGIEEEVLLPRDLALKVLDVQEKNGVKTITVMPDTTLNNLYGNNILRDNVDVLFNKVQEQKINLYDKLETLELGTPEHFQVASEAFYNGLSLPQNVIDAYPDLRVAQDLTKEIPDSWLLQAAQKKTQAQRIIGEFTKDIPLETFTNRYGFSYVYALGNGRYTKYPDVAIRQTGKAVMYDLGEGFSYRVDLEGQMENISMVVDEILKWEPTFKDFLSKGPEEQYQFVRKLFSDAANLANKSGETFLQHIDKMNLTKRGKKLKSQTEFFRIDVNGGEIIYPLANQPNRPKQLGEISLFKGMSPEQAMNIQPETIYKAMIKDELNKVEMLQEEYIQLKAKQKLKQSPSATKNELDSRVETQVKEIKKVKKQIEIAQNKRDSKIKSINSKSEDFNKIVKGAVDVSTEGKFIVGLFQNADLSTLVHETAHIFRRTVLDTELLSQAESALGVKDGKWTREAEEKFATSFERYLAEGKSPVAGLEGLFEQFKSWLTQIYIKLSQSPMDQDFSPEIRQVFDQLFSEERVKMAEQAGFKNEDISKALYQNTLTQHKDNLTHINASIKDLESTLKQDLNPDNTVFERLRNEKLARIQSKLDMLSTQQELTPDEIRDKMSEVSNTIRQAENEYAQVAESQLQKNKAIQSNLMEFYENELALDLQGLETYAKTLGLNEEQIARLLEEGDPAQPDLKLSALDDEAKTNEIITGALKEFGNCARGEL